MFSLQVTYRVEVSRRSSEFTRRWAIRAAEYAIGRLLQRARVLEVIDAELVQLAQHPDRYGQPVGPTRRPRLPARPAPAEVVSDAPAS